MASKQMRKTFECFFSLNRIANCLPFDCPKNSHVITFTTNKLRLCNWICLSVGICFVSLYLAIRLIYEIFNPSSSFTVPQIILYLVFLLVTIITDFMNITLGWRGDELASMINTIMLLDDTVKEVTLAAKPYKEPKVDILALWLRIQMPISIVPCIFVALFAVLHKIGPVNLFMKECIPVWLANSFILLIFAMVATFVGVMFCIFVVILYVHSAVLFMVLAAHWLKFFIHVWPKYYIGLQKMKEKENECQVVENPEKENSIEESKRQAEKQNKRMLVKGQKQKDLTPEQALGILRKIYGSLSVMNTMVNNHAILVSTLLMGVAFVLTIIVVYANVALRDKIPMPYFLFFPVINVFLFGAESILIPNGAKLNTQSEEFVSNWSKITTDGCMRRWLKSLRYIRINIGPFFYLNRNTTFAFFSNVFDWTIDLILTF